MNKQDIIRIIEAVESVITIEEVCQKLTGMGLEEGECNRVQGLWEILREHSKPQFQTDEDDDISDENFYTFSGVLTNMEMTAEQKYRILIGDNV